MYSYRVALIMAVIYLCDQEMKSTGNAGHLNTIRQIIAVTISRGMVVILSEVHRIYSSVGPIRDPLAALSARPH